MDFNQKIKKNLCARCVYSPMGWDSEDKKDMFIKNKIIDFIANLKYQTSLDDYMDDEGKERLA